MSYNPIPIHRNRAPHVIMVLRSENPPQQRLINGLLVALLVLLPFAEWKFIGLPINDRPFRINFDQYLSVSAFDLVFVALLVAFIPTFRQILSGGIHLCLRQLSWAFGIALVLLLFYQQRPSLPWLTPSSINVIDTRSLLISLLLALSVTTALLRVPLRSISRGIFVFSVASALGFIVLSVLAFSEFGYFRIHYPFTNPIAISFPFPNQNVAAPFIGLCLLGALGAGLGGKLGSLQLVTLPACLIAAVLTGSRANFVLLIVSVGVFVGLYWYQQYVWGHKSFWEASKALSLVLLGLFVGGVLITMNLHWQPVLRSVSILADLASNPSTLVASQPGSPRRELWTKAIARDVAPEASENRDFGVALVLVENGCKRQLGPVFGLRTGQRYSISLDLAPGKKMLSTGLSVFSDTRTNPIIKLNADFPSIPLPSVYAFAADSGDRLTMVMGTLINPRVTRSKGGTAVSLLTGAASLATYQEPFNGGAGPVLNVRDAELLFDARMRILRGFVSATSGHDPDHPIQLRYDLKLDRLSYSMPLDPPAMLYTGFHDSVNAGLGHSWGDVRNAVLVQLIRQEADWEIGVRRNREAEELFVMNERREISIDSDGALSRINNRIRCGTAGANRIADLWKHPVTEEVVGLTRAQNIFGGTVAKKRDLADSERIRHATSVIADISWSPDHHLQNRGSTHNAYLDWYYYVGPGALLLFVLLIGGKIWALGSVVWNHRQSPYFPLLLCVLLQLTLIAGTFYAQPYLWVKYVWVVIGLAGAVIAHPDLAERSSAVH